MAGSDWFDELLSVSDVLAAADEADLPLIVRLGGVGRAFAAHAAELTPDQLRRVGALIERILATGSRQDRDAMATGFLEALLAAWDRGFDLRSVWPMLGPESRAYCLAWNSFSGVDSPNWMRDGADRHAPFDT
jgi:hypothetical protein